MGNRTISLIWFLCAVIWQFVGAQDIAYLMTHGGDDRLQIAPETGFNKYFTSPVPFLNSTIVRSSCTSSSPTKEAFDATSIFARELDGCSDDFFRQVMLNIRARIINLLRVNPEGKDKPYVITMPSGSDAEMIISLLALMRHDSWNLDRRSTDCSLVLNVVAAAGEVGSGTSLAAGCRHFSTQIPCGSNVQIGALLNGLSEGLLEVIELPARIDGAPVQAKKLAVFLEDLVDNAVQRDNKIVVLHVVHFSKTGLQEPSFECALRLKRKYGKKIVIVVDAAQMRFDGDFIKWCMGEGMVVIITGSKFFGGPPFSSAVLIPEVEAAGLKNEHIFVPQGFSDYFSTYDIDDRLPTLKAAFAPWKNVGLALRWQAALYEMERFYTLDENLRRSIIERWHCTCSYIVSQSSHVRIYKNYPESSSEEILFQESFSSVISVQVMLPNSDFLLSRAANVHELKKIHALMTRDLSPFLLVEPGTDLGVAASTPCLIGQPVRIMKTDDDPGVVRIAISAPMVSFIAQQQSLDEAFLKIGKEDEIVVRKLSLIADNYEMLKNYA